MTALEVFTQQNGEVTKAYYADMNRRGSAGQLAVALFRAQKRSTAAKRYRGGHYTREAYSVKDWSVHEICRILIQFPQLGIAWGWGLDSTAIGFPWVLYVELPGIGQVSFHARDKCQGPDYNKPWDGQHASAERILAYCDSVQTGEPIRPAEPVPAADLSVRMRPSKATRLERELQRGGGKLAL